MADLHLNTCDNCGGHTEPFVDTVGELLCWDCYDGREQALADRQCDEMRDREPEGD